MLKQTLIFFFCLSVVGTMNVLAQSTLYIHQKDNTQKGYNLSDIKKLTFSSQKMSINKTDGNEDIIKLSDLRFFNFKVIPTGLLETEFTNNGVEIYPNPLSPNNTLSIQYQASPSGSILLEILDLNGVIVWQQKLNNQTNITTINFNGQHLPNGKYICRVTTNNKATIKPLIITND